MLQNDHHPMVPTDEAQVEYNGIGSEYAGIPLPGETPWRTITVGSSLHCLDEYLHCLLTQKYNHQDVFA